MQKQTPKSIQIGGLTVTETAEGNTVTLSIGDQATILTREDFGKLHEAANEFFAKKTIVKCGVCGQEMTGIVELSEKAAILTMEPCQVCARKEPANHENS